MSGALGFHMTASIGGADMPVVSGAASCDLHFVCTSLRLFHSSLNFGYAPRQAFSSGYTRPR